MPTLISWTNETWNPVSGCHKVSDGCKYCYAESLSLRYGWSKKPWTLANAPENVIMHPERLKKPLTWKKPSRVFVNSMSDLFHPLVPDEFIHQIFDVMISTPQHTYQILTKRPERAETWTRWAPNIWMGATVEDIRVKDRVGNIQRCSAPVKFLSCEPLLGSLAGIDFSGINWIIAGGNVKASKVEDTKGHTIKNLIIDNIVIGSRIMTDEYRAYRGIGMIYDHLFVKHHLGEYVKGIVHTNGIENFWSILKRGIVGIYHFVSTKHLELYLDEFTFRANTRDLTEEERFNLILSNCQGRLQYAELIAEA